MSGWRKWKAAATWGKALTARVVLYVLFAGFYQLHKYDSRVRREVEGWKEGMTYALKCSPRGPTLLIQKAGGRLWRLDPRTRVRYDTGFIFKNLDRAFPVLIGLQGLAGAYARHAFAMKGDMATAMTFARCMDYIEGGLFPGFMARRILKRVPEREISAVFLYRKIVQGIWLGEYAYKKGVNHNRYKENAS